MTKAGTNREAVVIDKEFVCNSSLCFISSLTLRALSPCPSPSGRGGTSEKEKPPAIARKRLSGELLGLTCVLAVTFGKKVSQ